MVLCENPETLPKSSVGMYLTTLSDEHMRKIAIASLLATASMSFLDQDDLLVIWKETLRLNRRTA